MKHAESSERPSQNILHLFKFPSIPAAILTGATAPLIMGSADFIETTFSTQLVLMLWMVIGLMVPFARSQPLM